MFRSNKRRQAFEDEALPHLDALYAMALRLTRNERDAEDLVQDTMVKAFRFFHRYQTGSNAKAWLFKVLVNLFYNERRRTKREQQLQVDCELAASHEHYLSEATCNGQVAEQLLLDRLVVEKLQAAIDELPEEFRLAVVLCDLHDFSYKEIAEILECPVGTVMSRLYRGRRQLEMRLHDFAVEAGYSPRRLPSRAAGGVAADAGPAAGAASADASRGAGAGANGGDGLAAAAKLPNAAAEEGAAFSATDLQSYRRLRGRR